jgi:hypothetical protein
MKSPVSNTQGIIARVANTGEYLETGDMRDHMSQQRIAGNVEGHAETLQVNSHVPPM